ncbi:MAG: PPC domain-containing DNA-binding protein [Desulfobacterales bacterium]
MTYSLMEYRTARHFIGTLGMDSDLIGSVAAAAQQAEVAAAQLTVWGTLIKAVMGCFDPAQMVYVTWVEDRPMELVNGSGILCMKDEEPFVRLHGLVADDRGNCRGGRLFPGTVAFSIEYVLREWTEPPPTRRYDPATGLQRLVPIR